jgi:hypothetical protein
MTSSDSDGRRRRQRVYWLLVLPFIGTLWPPFYNRVEPRLGSIPFFYWYQFLWIGIGTAITAVVYLVTRDDER